VFLLKLKYKNDKDILTLQKIYDKDTSLLLVKEIAQHILFTINHNTKRTWVYKVRIFAFLKEKYLNNKY